ncbi:FRG domain-containing protein [Sphingobacterium paludis]|uniref:FRG domain-containing protein n=1 Tax=Sphingobacterium paludis TaxID=1476465 RepID=A0A4R7D0R5_9SPHI|nr:FRG domain-containing protein [Sphingobacterium paludis]TDS13064.1 FRG domain-containing protein [Sphingobacterium paludis]
MRRIQPELTDELLKHFGDPSKVGASDPFPVETFRELVEHTAKLAFKNKDHLIFYRGQSRDYKNKAGSSSFYPSIYRGDYLPIRELTNRFDILEGASKALVDLFDSKKIEGYKELKRRKAVQWSVLQHYEVCHTPYLDFTHSLRVACSFATMDNAEDFAYVFVFGLPYLTNRITINSEHDLINIRLLSICPPTALRPYFQEGYLAGTDDITTSYDTKTELDFNNRLLAKFKIPNNKSFWGKGFDQIPIKSLYPDKDPIFELCQQIKYIADKELRTGDLGEFLKSWAELEEKLITLARKQTDRFLSVREANRMLLENGYLDKEQSLQIDRLRTFRNTLVHTPKKVTTGQILDFLYTLDEILKTVKK